MLLSRWKAGVAPDLKSWMGGGNRDISLSTNTIVMLLVCYAVVVTMQMLGVQRRSADVLAEMANKTDLQTNGRLLESYRLLLAGTTRGETPDVVRLAKAVIVDELAKRNTHLQQALDAWEADPENTVSHDHIVLQHAEQMKPQLRFHIAHPMDRDPFAGIDSDEW